MTVAANGRSETEVVDAPLHPWTERPWHVVQDSVFNIQRHWVERLGRGEAPDTSGADNLHVLKLAMAAYESAENGRTVTVALATGGSEAAASAVGNSRPST